MAVYGVSWAYTAESSLREGMPVFRDTKQAEDAGNTFCHQFHLYYLQFYVVTMPPRMVCRVEFVTAQERVITIPKPQRNLAARDRVGQTQH